MESSIAQQWYERFLATVQKHEASSALKDAALREQLGKWTQALTAVVVATCEATGRSGAAKRHG